MTFDEVRQIALSFPEVEEHLTFGSPTFKIRKRFLACIAKIDADALCVKVPSKLEREYLISEQPEIYFSTDHYANFDSILVRMSKVNPDDLRELFEAAWVAYAPKKLVKVYQDKK